MALTALSVDFVFVRHDSAYFMQAWSALAAPSVDFVFVRHDSAYFMQAWSALAAPSVLQNIKKHKHVSVFFVLRSLIRNFAVEMKKGQ
ncbi:MAG: hypothetical protein IJ539_01085 [Prevotella sp.]|nr:hypothetical protein [Prevotella sp.]